MHMMHVAFALALSIAGDLSKPTPPPPPPDLVSFHPGLICPGDHAMVSFTPRARATGEVVVRDRNGRLLARFQDIHTPVRWRTPPLFREMLPLIATVRDDADDGDTTQVYASKITVLDRSLLWQLTGHSVLTWTVTEEYKDGGEDREHSDCRTVVSLTGDCTDDKCGATLATEEHCYPVPYVLRTLVAELKAITWDLRALNASGDVGVRKIVNPLMIPLRVVRDSPFPPRSLTIPAMSEQGFPPTPHDRISVGAELSSVHLKKVCATREDPTNYSPPDPLFDPYQYEYCLVLTPKITAELVCPVSKATSSAASPQFPK